MSLSVDGVWKAGVWATTVWADGVWREGAPPAPTPATIGGWFDYHGTKNLKKRQKELEEQAKEVIEEIKAEPLKITSIQTKAENVSRQLKEAIAELEIRAAMYQQELERQANFKRFSERQNELKQAAELQYLMIQAELQAESARRQVEELDVVFMTMVLLSA